MSKLVIIGARAMRRETCSYARECGMGVKGFLDSKTDALDGFTGYPPIFDSVENYTPEEDDVFVVALGESKPRREYASIIAAKGGRFISVIHPSAIIGDNVQIGEGCIVCPGAVIGNDAKIGNHCIIGVQSLVAHDCVLEDFVSISPGCHIAGGCKMGEGVFFGIHSAAVPKLVIGNDVFVGAGAVVTKSFESGKLVGIPAHNILSGGISA